MLCSKCKVRDVEADSQKAWCKECRSEARKAALEFKRDHPKRVYDGRSYESRNTHLLELGFRSYAEYLNSDLWRAVRTKVFRVKGRLCIMCGAVATSVHHNRYHKNDLLGRNLQFLVPVCHDCHKKLEFSKKGRKVDLNCARDRFNNASKHLSDLILNYDAEFQQFT